MIKIFDYLQSNGIDVYFQGQYVGEAKNEIVVLRDAGTIGNKFTGKVVIDVMLYVPIKDITKLYDYKKKIKNILKEYKNANYTGDETSIIADDEKKAYTCSLSYELYKRS